MFTIPTPEGGGRRVMSSSPQCAKHWDHHLKKGETGTNNFPRNLDTANSSYRNGQQRKQPLGDTGTATLGTPCIVNMAETDNTECWGGCGGKNTSHPAGRIVNRLID